MPTSRSSLLLALLCCCVSFALKAQESRLISYACTDCSLAEVLAQWEKQYHLAFAYETGLVAEEQVSVTIRNIELAGALEQLFARTDISFDIVDEQYIVLRARKWELRPLKLCGKIVNARTQEPLPFANVQVAGATGGANSRDDGQFSLSGRFDERQRVIISYLGFEKKATTVGALLRTPCPTLALQPASQLMPEVVVRGFTIDMLERNEDDAIHRITFRPEKIPTLPGWGEPDVLRSLHFLPGVSSADESAANLNIRGGASDQNLLLWDGIPIYHAGHFFGLYSAFNPYVVDEATVYRGDFGAEYGGRVSGVIDIVGKPEPADRPHLGFGLNLINAHAYAELPLPDSTSTLLLAGRRSYTDLLRSGTFQNLFNSISRKGRLSFNRRDANQPGEDITVEPDFFYEDYNAKWVWQPGKTDELAVSGYFGKDRLDYSFNENGYFATQDELELSNAGASLQYARNWNDNWRTRLTVAYSQYRNHYFFSYTFEPETIPFLWRFRHTNNLTDATVTLKQTWRIDDHHRLQGGGQYIRQRLFYRYREQDRNEELEFGAETLHSRTTAFFLDYQGRFFEQLEVQLGVRRENYRSLFENEAVTREERNWQPRLSLRWQPGAGPLQLQCAAGSYRQYLYQVPASYSDLGAGEQLWVAADDYFPSLRATQWSAGVVYRKKDLLVELAYYRKRTMNLSSWKLELEENLENPFTQDGQARAHGLDLLINKRFGAYSSWLAYSLARVKNRFPDLNEDTFFPAPHDQRHQLSWTHMVTLHHWEFSMSWWLHSGSPYTTPDDYETVIDEAGNPEYFPRYERPNNRRLPAYHRLDLAANYKFEKKSWSGKIGLSVFNLYNRANLLDIDFYVFPPNFEEEQFVPELVAFEREMLRLTPNIFVQLEW